MQNTHTQHKTPAELQELCNFVNWLHVRVWLVIAALVFVGAIFKNPYHIATAALCVLISRARWEVSDLKALE